MTRDEIADRWLVSPHNASPFGTGSYRGPHTAAEHIAHIRKHKPFALHAAYQVADFVADLGEEVMDRPESLTPTSEVGYDRLEN